MDRAIEKPISWEPRRMLRLLASGSRRTSKRAFTSFYLRLAVVGICLAGLVGSLVPQTLFAADLSELEVKTAIEKGKKFLISEQGRDGSWAINEGAVDDRIGVTGLCVLALLNCGMSPQDPTVSRGLSFLRTRTFEDLSGQHETYQTSVLIMALAAARDKADVAKIAAFAERLEKGQITNGNIGAWPYQLHAGGILSGGDQSNTQFAILGLREAVEAGYSASRETWERARDYWELNQNHDGGWGYFPSGNERAPSRGSMTVAGVSSLAIIQQMLKSDAGVAEDGTPPCCNDPVPDKALQNGINWLGKYYSAAHNPGPAGHAWQLYYTYGVERAGRLAGLRFFGEHDWYREGTAYLLFIQDSLTGHFSGTSSHEKSPVCGTSFALLFLSKGLAPVLINKLKYGSRHPNNPNILLDNNWNRHSRDVRNLTELISSMPKWPKLLTSQELDLARAVKSGGVNTLMQAPVLFITGAESLSFSAEETKLLKQYLEEGGFIFATPSCQSSDFEASFRELVTQLMPPGEGELKPLPPEHPVYRSEHPLKPEGVPLFGVDFGCRTSIIYSPEDLGCLWDYWAKVDPPKRNVQLKAKIIRATQIGVNVMAYATGREPPDKTQIREVVANASELDNVERGLLQIAQIKHEGAWNAAPRALRNLLISLNETVGLSASTKTKELTFGDKNIFRYPVLYMHGRNRFSIPAEERQQLRLYLERGGVLVADACCGAKQFDKGFRDLMQQLFPDKKLDRIPVSHELFSDKVGRDIKLLKRRTAEGVENASGGNYVVRTAEPILEGIELDGRYVVIYSKYDISCALERQNSGSCEGYLPEDAVQLGTNIILYSMLQGVRFKNPEAAGDK